MSVAEQAIADSRRILEAGLLDIFFPDASGNVLAASNADFYNAFLNLVGGGEAYRNRDGSVRQNLSPRIRAAVLAAMLNPERRETVERLLDNPEGYNALINGLMQSAANLAELANKPEYDLSGELSQAVELFVETRDKGQTVDEFAAQTDMFREAPSAETMFLMRLFEENAKSSGGISGVLRQYAAECKKIDTTTQSLFGDENPTKLEKLEEAYRHYAADLSNEAGNGNLRWRDTGEPAAEEISEAQKQYEEVKSKYVGTPLWMKAPNGKRTNLTEEQWVRVRTPNFKRWFDDWEMLAEAYPEHEIFDIDEAYKFARGNLQGGEFTSKDGHTATLGRSGIDKMNSGLARGKTGNNRLHALAFANVGKLFENSELLEAEPPRDGDSNIKQYLKFYAPLYMDGRFYVVKITARELYSRNKLYSLEGLDIIEESEYRGQPRGSKENSISADYSDSVKNFVRKIREVKRNVSKVVDENGEPKVVYHGTPKFDRFSIFKKGSGGYLGPAIYFTNLKAYAQKYENKWGDGGNLYDVFISLKRPLIVKSVNPAKEILKTIYGKDSVYDRRSQKQSYDTKILSSADIKKLQSKGYDGVIWEYGGSKEYAVYDSSKIKSATDNIGTFNTNNPDIRWREVSEPIKQKFSSGNTSLRQIAAGFKKIDFKPGTTNFDLGGGKFDEGTKYLETKGVKNFVFDPVNRDSKTNKEAFEIVKNGGFDTTTCNNVLNVISEANVRDNIILQAAKSLRPNGTAYFTVYEGDGSGKGRQSQKDSWQEHRKTVDYLGEIKKHFGDVSLKNKVITARKPILLNEKASWFMDDSFENPVRWKDDADISDISAKVKKIIDSISDKKNKHIEVLRKISDTEADFLLKKTGLDLKGYSHSIDNYSILHILKKHGSEKELQRGQIPVTIKDIQNFPTIVSDYDDVKYAGKSKIGRDTIRFEKNIGDNLVLVFEEMRIGKKLLALSTMYIQKRKKLTSNANASSNTSETLSTSSDFQESANTPENQENNSRLKALLRQDRRENPVIWASIVLAKQILLGRAITVGKLEKVLPSERFDGTKREYAVNRAREIAERYRADKEKFGNDLNLGVQRAENDLYWTRDVVEEMYASFRRDGEEYGIARQRLMEWLKERRRRDLETVKGLSSEELGIDVPAAIEDALEKEPERRKPGENAAEESGVETFEASGEGIDAEIESAREKPAPSSIRDIIGKIRAGVTKAAKARGMDEAARRRAYRNTLAEVLRESAKRLTYGREREAIMKKISDLSAKGYSVIKIKDGERAGQKIDNYTLRAEHIALRIFNRGVRDTKRELSEKFEKIVSRKGKKPSRMERDDKRTLAGAVQMRVYNIKRYSEMDAAELEAEYSATVDRLENVEKNFAERIRHYGAFAKAISKEIRKRAAIVQYGLPPFPASDTIQYRPLCGQSKRRKREQKSSNPKMRCITCESDKTLARLISIKLDLSLYASAPDSYCHASLAA